MNMKKRLTSGNGVADRIISDWGGPEDAVSHPQPVLLAVSGWSPKSLPAWATWGPAPPAEAGGPRRPQGFCPEADL